MVTVSKDGKVIATYQEGISAEMKRQLKAAGYKVKETNRDNNHLSGR